MTGAFSERNDALTANPQASESRPSPGSRSESALSNAALLAALDDTLAKWGEHEWLDTHGIDPAALEKVERGAATWLLERIGEEPRGAVRITAAMALAFRLGAIVGSVARERA
jgi:hypothetical protein